MSRDDRSWNDGDKLSFSELDRRRREGRGSREERPRGVSQAKLEAASMPNTRWQRPVPGHKFCQCREDRVFRGVLGTRGQRIMLPNLYRIRHSHCGRESETTRL